MGAWRHGGMEARGLVKYLNDRRPWLLRFNTNIGKNNELRGGRLKNQTFPGSFNRSRTPLMISTIVPITVNPKIMRMLILIHLLHTGS
jgi:hypothetical protein